MTTGSREGAKPRSSDEGRTIMGYSADPPGCPHALALGRGRPVGPEGQVEMEVGSGCFSGGRILGKQSLQFFIIIS